MNGVPRIVGLGETLWDVFPDGPRLGGAPLNFCCSASELSQDTARVSMVSAVGDDDLGHRAVEAITKHGVDTHCVQIGERRTGEVLVELDASGVASYRFGEDRAWDHLVWSEPLAELASECDAVCFGTLGQRSGGSRKTIQQFVRATKSTTLRILDVNLRSPFYDDDVIRESLALANVLKLNDDELPLVERICGVSGKEADSLRKIADQHQLRCVALTRGSKGAMLVRGDEISDVPGSPVEVIDTVGAGDAFTAAMTLGLLRDNPIESVIQAAIKTASFVCSQPGATMRFPDQIRSLATKSS